MEISITNYQRCDLVKGTGRIDAETVPGLEEAFLSIIDSGKSGIVFDLSSIDLISSRGLWLLLDTQKACKKKNGKLVLVGASDEMLRSFEIAGVTHFIEIYDDITAAVGSF